MSLKPRARRLLLTVAAGLGPLACDAGPGAPSDVALGAEFALAPGESALAGDDGLRVSFESVTEDSRCPMDVICVWAGRVVVDVTAGRGEARHFALSPGDAADVDGLRLRLVRVEPYPSAAEPIPASAYRATIVVDRP
jgi:hypothetical protein